MAAMTAWLLLAVGENRQHGGNAGYDDDLEAVYRWDSTVPNHARPARGDVIALWNKRQLLGTGVIARIDLGYAKKLVYRCSECSGANIKPRKTKLPLYRCFDCFKEFDTPKAKPVAVSTYAAAYEATWRAAETFVAGAILRKVAMQPRAQNSIRQLNWAEFAERCLNPRTAAGLTVASGAVAEGHVLRLARARIGQAAFRAKLLEQYGPFCAMSGECPLEVLEAAHLYSYAMTGRHHERGGLLFRRDIHRLFDNGLIAVHPEKLQVDLSSSLNVFSTYAELQDRPLQVTVSAQQRMWLREHWRQHREILH